jgi:hypothetical protein
MDELTGGIFDVKDTKVPRFNNCFVCHAWLLEKDLMPIEVPDQGNGYIRKLACRPCLNEAQREK